MVLQYITGAGNSGLVEGQTFLETGDDLIITENVVYTGFPMDVPFPLPQPPANTVIFAEGTNSITVLGDVYGAENVVEVQFDPLFIPSGPSTLQVGATGTLQSSGGTAVLMRSIAQSLSNFGTIATNGTDTSDHAVDMAVGSFLNHGTIFSAYGAGLRMDTGSGSTAEIINTGYIGGATGISFSRAREVEVTNSGTIVGQDMAISIASNRGAVLQNLSDGNILGDIELSRTVDQMVNRGDIAGDVYLDCGDDVFDGLGGAVTGTVFGGNGDDIFHIDQRGATVHGNNGQDSAFVRSFDATLISIESVTLVQDDPLVMTKLNLRGGPSNVTGSEGMDRISGSVSGDDISGGAGEDILLGGRGTDRLQGGTGADRLVGGADADVFVFAAAGEMDGDVIADFQAGIDRIDLCGLVPGDLDLAGNAVFSGEGQAELRLRATDAGHLRVQVDLDGDGQTDALLTLLGVTTLDAADLLL